VSSVLYRCVAVTYLLRNSDKVISEQFFPPFVPNYSLRLVMGTLEGMFPYVWHAQIIVSINLYKVFYLRFVCKFKKYLVPPISRASKIKES
jgi:hypothetical protein